ncbi:YdcF family protein [Spirillospora sp. CA-253888]
MTLPEGLRADVEVLWDYHHMGHAVRPADVGIGLGSHDPGVASHAAALYHRGLFPLIVFTGANAPTTAGRFPRGEAVHYREHALELGVPDEAVLVETEAVNTGQNIELTRALLAERGVAVRSAVLISRPYQQRRAYATAAKLWPELEVVCASRPLPLAEYIAEIGDADRVVTMLVGDTQRVIEYPARGFAIAQEVPTEVEAAYRRLVAAGFTGRLLTTDRPAAAPAP